MIDSWVSTKFWTGNFVNTETARRAEDEWVDGLALQWSPEILWLTLRSEEEDSVML